MSRGWFVTGTDTGIGKTLVTAGLVRALARAGQPTAACKPISAGLAASDPTDPDSPLATHEDVIVLQAACAEAGLALPATRIGPVQLPAACAPNVAAALAGRDLSAAQLLPLIQSALAQLQSDASCLVVEGVGGFLVPLTPLWDTADLAVSLQLPVILVVGLRLGCLNHALLTAEAVLARGLPLAGWVANTIDPTMIHLDETFQTLEAALAGLSPAPCLGRIPRLTAGTALDRARASADHLAVAALLAGRSA